MSGMVSIGAVICGIGWYNTSDLILLAHSPSKHGHFLTFHLTVLMGFSFESLVSTVV